MNIYHLDDIPDDLKRYFQPVPQLGLEKTPEEYVARMVEVFREVRRVLRDDGTLWLNIGDSYASGGGWSGHTTEQSPKQATNNGSLCQNRKVAPDGLKPKDLVGIPWRLAFALQADGWYLRSDIIWSKPNPMPESVTDRPTKAHEYLFLLTKKPRYYYDAEAVKEAGATGAWEALPPIGGLKQTNGNDNPTYSGNRPASDGRRNLRSVWTITTQPFREAHFATFPEKLVEPCIKAGTSLWGCCPECGAGWVRVVEKAKNPSKEANVGIDLTGGAPNMGGNRQTSIGLHRNGGNAATGIPNQTLGWRPSCKCDAGEPVPATVLDCFSGAGTTGVVAVRLGRNYIGIELNEKYNAMAERRLASTQREHDTPLLKHTLREANLFDTNAKRDGKG